MELSWKDSPFLRILLPLMTGIVLYEFIPSTKWILGVVMCLMFMISIGLFSFLTSYYKHRFKWIKGVLLQFFIVSFGYTSCILNSVNTSDSWYKKFNDHYKHAYVSVKEDPQEKPKTMKVIVEVDQLMNANQKIDVIGKAILYLQKSTRSQRIRMGDHLIIQLRWKDIQALGNPGEFNYAEYSHRQQIYQTAFLKESQWELTNTHSKNITILLNEIGCKIRRLLKKHISNPVSFGIAEALLMGYRNDIDQDVWQAYSKSGIAHIIAISGMHMAMIYTSMRWLLLLIPFLKTKRMLTTGLAILAMWFFAGITGLPPSVTRAAIMFTCWGIGEMLDKNVNGTNNLAMSACVLLCINPSWLMDIGFQLSYMAVLSLIMFYSPIYQRIHVSNFILDQIWKLLSATMAAQILTFPLCIYYFHQFPLLFLLTNLIAVPATTIILYLEIVYLLICWFNPIGKWLGIFISESIAWMNRAVDIVSHWSFATWDGIYINPIQVIILYLCICCCSSWLWLKKARMLQFSLIFIVLLSLTELHRIHKIETQKLFLVYNLSGKTRLEFIHGHTYFSPDDDSIQLHSTLERFTIKPSHLQLGINISDSSLVQSYKHSSLELYSFQNKTFLRLLNSNMKFARKIHIDVLILTKGALHSLTWIEENCQASMIILDSSIPYWKLDDYKSELSLLKIPLYCVNDKGAFMTSF